MTVAGEGASQGRSSGGQVVLVTKSGTNALHGSLYEFNRNTATAANTWFNNQSGVPRQPLVRNQFGGSVGGPINVTAVLFLQLRRAHRCEWCIASPRGAFRFSSRGQSVIRLTDGSTQTLTPQEVRVVDPLNVGPNANVLKLLNQYPSGKIPGTVRTGLNFSGFRFNAPSSRRAKPWSASSISISIRPASTFSIRGTLADNTDDQVPRSCRARDRLHSPRQEQRIVRAVHCDLPPSLINSFTFGYTRFSPDLSGVSGPVLFQTGLDPLQNPNARPIGQRLPTFNPTDDITWSKGKHTITFGVNGRFIHNDTKSYANSFAHYGYGATELIGLGADIDNSVTGFTQRDSGPMRSLPTRLRSPTGRAPFWAWSTTISIPTCSARMVNRCRRVRRKRAPSSSGTTRCMSEIVGAPRASSR